MQVKEIKDEDFLNYKKPSMFIATCKCSWKCCKEKGYDISICQNSKIAEQPTIDYDDDKIVKRYINNPLTSAIVFSGLEPLDQFKELIDLIKKFREYTEDDIVIYTGYNKDEVWTLPFFKEFKNIIIKFGRYIMGEKPHFDEVLGIELASDNQYAEKIS